MRKFGLIGDPIAHSLSPALFKAAYDGKYPYDLIEGSDFDVSYQKFLNGYETINVTAPFKEMAFLKADIASPECKAIGAANILTKMRDGRIMAQNSDIAGVIGAIHSDKPTKKIALIVGCGGAAKAAAYAMGTEGYVTIIINRNYERARDYAQKLNVEYGLKVWARPMEEFRKWFRESGVIIYTLPVTIGAINELSSNDIRGNSFFRKENKIILEANYKNPSFTTELITKMQKINSRITFVSGKEWLLHQAIGAYKIFTGESPDLERMRKEL